MANLTYVPLLKVQREPYEVADRRERFGTYLRTMFDQDGSTPIWPRPFPVFLGMSQEKRWAWHRMD